MLRMSGFEVVQPTTPEEAVALFASSPSPAWLAGGTDLLPSLKQGLLAPRTVIALGRALPRQARRVGETLELGAGMPLSQVATLGGPEPLPQAAGHVASPQIRAMGTLGGNVMLDTRCRFLNQSPAWRQALGGCLRAEGDICQVNGSPRSCVATQCSDTVPALLVLDARLRLLGPEGSREVPLEALLRFDGMRSRELEPGELLTWIVLPDPAPGTVAEAEKVAMRGSIDFPLVVVAGAARFEGGLLAGLRIAIGAVGPQPRLLPDLDAHLGQPLDDARIDTIVELVLRRTRPQGSLAGDTAWRRHMTGVVVGRLLRRLRERALG